MRKLILPLALAGSILLIVGCPSPSSSSSTSGGSPPANGSLTINLPLVQVKAVRSPNDTVVSYYDVSGSGPGKATFLKQGIRDTSVTIDSLTPGDWGVLVNGNNFSGLLVASASVHVAVVAGETATRDVAVEPSLGDFHLSLEWPVSQGIVSVSAFLSPEGSAPYAITLPHPPYATTGAVSSVSATAAVPAGSYTMSRVFTESTGFVSGGADAVQIQSGSTTELSLSVVSGVNETIKPDISKAIPVTFTGWRPILGKGTFMTVTAAPTISKQFNLFSYQWYLNGGALPGETGNAITLFAKDHPTGSYRLDCVVSSRGTLSSDTLFFTVPGM